MVHFTQLFLHMCNMNFLIQAVCNMSDVRVAQRSMTTTGTQSTTQDIQLTHLL